MPPDAFRGAGWFWKPVLRLSATPAITMPWGRVYWDTEGLDSGLITEIVLHETVHLAQIERDGAIRWTFTYLVGLLRYGYWDHPLEIEARSAHE